MKLKIGMLALLLVASSKLFAQDFESYSDFVNEISTTDGIKLISAEKPNSQSNSNSHEQVH